MSFVEVTQFLLDGFWISLLIFAVTLLCGAPLGLPIAFCSMSRFKPVRYVSKVIVWIVRGIPLMLQIFIIFYVPGLLFDKPIFSELDRYFFKTYRIQDAGRVIAVLIAFTLNYACYFSEIYRGGIESISKGQYEAGYVLGLTKSLVAMLGSGVGGQIIEKYGVLTLTTGVGCISLVLTLLFGLACLLGRFVLKIPYVSEKQTV